MIYYTIEVYASESITYNFSNYTNINIGKIYMKIDNFEKLIEKYVLEEDE